VSTHPVCLSVRGSLYTSIVVPDEGYLAQCYALCKQYNVLLICDEIQTVCTGLDCP
jgi:adenosylmethionine-8-amino-7-oxononanoate aminotransferase